MRANGETRLETLKKREQAIKDAIAIERVRRQRREEKLQERLAGVIGSAALAYVVDHPEFSPALKELLQSVTGESERKLLRAKGWL
jgi:uncharacterized protein (DUF2342 family)